MVSSKGEEEEGMGVGGHQRNAVLDDMATAVKAQYTKYLRWQPSQSVSIKTGKRGGRAGCEIERSQ